MNSRRCVHITQLEKMIETESFVCIIEWFDEDGKRILLKSILFETICDGFSELESQIIVNQNERECEQ